MNYDEIPAGEEMDRLVAERVMGWRHGGMPWAPSRDIGHAWAVLERLPRIDTRVYQFGAGYACEVLSNSFEGNQVAHAFAEKAPLAICRAALLVAEYK